MSKTPQELRSQDARVIRNGLEMAGKALESVSFQWGLWCDDVRQCTEARLGVPFRDGDPEVPGDAEYGAALDLGGELLKLRDRLKAVIRGFGQVEQLQAGAGIEDQDAARAQLPEAGGEFPASRRADLDAGDDSAGMTDADYYDRLYRTGGGAGDQDGEPADPGPAIAASAAQATMLIRLLEADGCILHDEWYPEPGVARLKYTRSENHNQMWEIEVRPSAGGSGGEQR